METRQMTPFFYLLFRISSFFASSICNNYFYNLKIIKFHFDVVPFIPFWPVKMPNFCERLPIPTAYYTFLESRHPEVA